MLSTSVKREQALVEFVFIYLVNLDNEGHAGSYF